MTAFSILRKQISTKSSPQNDVQYLCGSRVFELECETDARGGGVLPCMGHIGMCRCEGYGFQAVYSSIGYINQSFWV